MYLAPKYLPLVRCEYVLPPRELLQASLLSRQRPVVQWDGTAVSPFFRVILPSKKYACIPLREELLQYADGYDYI